MSETTTTANTKASITYGPEVQRLNSDAPIEDIIYLLKRDGGVFLKGLIPEEKIDQAYNECLERLESDGVWEGKFFPKETQRAPGMIALSPTYTYTQVMNPVYQAVCNHFLTTRSWFWWGDEYKESVSKPYVHSCAAMRIGPGGKAQPLHRDDYIGHNIHTEIAEWNDVRDVNRETAVGLFVAGSKVTKQNGGTAFIQGSHLWGTDRKTPPDPSLCIHAEMEKGDAFIMLASAFHGGGSNVTKDEKRMMFATFATRGYLRQEENQFLAVPADVARKYSREVLQFMGYSLSDPAGGYVDQIDPIYHLLPELKAEAKYQDF